MSLESFNSTSPGIGMGSLPGSIATTNEEGNTATIKDTDSQDTISPSQAEAMMAQFLPSSPMLQPPTLTADPSGSSSLNVNSLSSGASVLSLADQLNQAGQNVMKGWSDALQKRADETHEYLNSAAYRVWREHNSPSEVKNINEVRASGASKTQAQQDAITDSENVTANPNVPTNEPAVLSKSMASYNALVANKDPDAVGALPFAMTALIIPGVTSPGIVDTVSSREVSTKPLVNASYVNDTVANLPLGDQKDMRAELGLIGALFAVGAQTHAEATNTVEALKGEKPHNNKQLAENYANKILDTVNNPNFNALLKGLMSGTTSDGKPLTDSQVNERTAIFKMVLLATSLMALYAAGTKYIKKEDFNGMLNGTTTPSDLEAKIIAAFNGIKNSGQISSNTYNTVMQGLQAYADKNPDFSSFFSVDDAFNSIAETLNVQQQTANSVPINTPT